MTSILAQNAAQFSDPISGEVDIRIANDGTWFHEGGPINRKELVCLFASVLKRDELGEFWLQTPVEKARIEVDDAPFVAVELFACECGCDQKLSVRTNIDEVVPIGLDNPIRVEHDPETDEPAPYVTIKKGDGLFPIEAKINRNVFYELVNRGVEETIDDEVYFGVWSNNEFFPLGQLDEA